MRARRVALALAMIAAAGCARGEGRDDPAKAEVIDARARRAPAPEGACEMIVTKMRTCRDAILMTARTSMVAGGMMPEEAVEMSVEISEGFERDTSEICALYPESDMVRGTRCFPVDPCEAFAGCIVEGAKPAAVAAGPLAPSCPDGSTAVMVERDGETTRWCVRPDGLPNGPYRVHDGERLTVEGVYVMGVPHGTWTHHLPDGKNHVRVFEEGVVVEMDGQRMKK